MTTLRGVVRVYIQSCACSTTACMCNYIKSVIILTYTAIPCTAIPELPNGVINLDLTAKTVAYTCNTGYELLNGDAMRTCMLDGTWSGAHPMCIGKKSKVEF